MNYKMVNLDISDLFVKTSLAYILDRDGVPERIYEIRHAWKVKGPIPSVKFQEWIDGYHDDLSLTKEASDYYSNNVDQFEIETSRNGNVTINKLEWISKISKFNAIDFEVELLMKKFGINPKYKKVIIKAIVCNEINDDDLKEIQLSKNYDFLLDSQELRFVIERQFVGQEKTEIDRDRKWYWMHDVEKVGSYSKIAKIENEFGDNIKQQIRRYRLFLQGGTSK